MKKCSTCKQEKALDDFYKDSRTKDGLYRRCKDCHNEQQREARKRPDRRRVATASQLDWAKRNPEKMRLSRRRHALKTLYGITIEEYDARVLEQQGRCAICFKEAPLVVDHCHETERVRGLLCDRCNVGLGCFADSRTNLQAALEYLG